MYERDPDEQRHHERTLAFRKDFESPSLSQSRLAIILPEVASPRFSRVILDNSTLDYGLLFTQCREGFERAALGNNRRLIAAALTSLIEAIVLVDEIICGPGVELSLASPGGAGSGLVVRRPEQDISSESLFWLLSNARTQAIQFARSPRVLDALTQAGGRRVSQDGVTAFLTRLTVHGSERSIHKIAHLLSRDEFYHDDMSNRLLAQAQHATHGLNGQDVLEEAANALNVDLHNYRHVPHQEDHIEDFFAAYLLYRTMAYLLLADAMGCTYRGDRLRSPVARAVLDNPQRLPFSQVVVDALQKSQNDRDGTLNRLLGYEAFKVTIPLVANAVLSRATTRSECLSIALELRESRAARRFRSFCRSIDDAIASGHRRRVELAFRDLSKFGVALGDTLTQPAGFDVMDIKEIVSFASPVMAAALPALKWPVTQILDKLRTRKFALLDEVRNPQASVDAVSRIEALWSTLPPDPDWRRGRDFWSS